jgi:hypothetical protein
MFGDEYKCSANGNVRHAGDMKRSASTAVITRQTPDSRNARESSEANVNSRRRNLGIPNSRNETLGAIILSANGNKSNTLDRYAIPRETLIDLDPENSWDNRLGP